MRLIVDLFPSQTESRFRGIGRYTLSLAKAMAAQAGAHEMRVLANGAYASSAAQLRTEFAGLVAPGAYATYTHPPMDPHDTDDLRRETVASALIHAGYQAIGADALLCASPFEGWGECGVVPQADDRLPAGLKVAVLYDFIPWLFPKQHLDPVPEYRKWYARRLATLRQYDLLLAISDATRADAIRLLDLAPERVVNISGAADAKFRKLSPQELAATDLRRFGIDRPFVLYTGNSDYRKNLAGMLGAFARLPAHLRDTHQLVVNQVGNVELFMLQVAAAGLRRDSVVVTGHVTDDELLALYNRCTVFVFPSLYEGFGLPVLEAMGCGAAVIAGDNSSIPEVAGRADILFDAASPDAIASTLRRALTDDAWRTELQEYGLAHAARFSWDRTAQRAWRAIEAAHASRTQAALCHPAAPALPRLRVAAVPPLSPGPVRQRAQDLVQALAPFADIEPVSDQAGAGLSRDSLPGQWNRFDTVLYVAAAASLTPALVALIRSAPGILLLLDEDGAGVATLPAGDAGAGQILRDEGLQGLVARHRGQANRTGSSLPLGRSLLEALRCLVVEDEGMASALRQACEPGTLPELIVLDPGNYSDEAARARRMAAALRSGAARNWRWAAARIAAAWAGSVPPDAELEEVSRHAERNLRLNRTRRILVDLTRCAAGAPDDMGRAALETARDMCLADNSPTPIELVQLRDGSLQRARGVIGSLFGIGEGMCPADQIDIQPGDTLFMIDPAWDRFSAFLPVFEAIRQFGGRIVTALPGPPADLAGQALQLAAAHSDLLLCPAEAACGELAARIAEQRTGHAPAARVACWPAGGAGRSAGEALRLLRTAFE